MYYEDEYRYRGWDEKDDGQMSEEQEMAAEERYYARQELQGA